MANKQGVERVAPVRLNQFVIKRQLWFWGLTLTIVAMALGLAGWITWNALPTDSTYPITFIVAPGSSLSTITVKAEEAGLVRSPFLLYTLLSLRYDPSRIKANAYTFVEPSSVFAVARILGTGAGSDIATRLTIPEGMRIRDVATLVAATIPNISAAEYENAAAGKEGYLFPETYFVPSHYQASDLVNLQLDTFAQQTAEIQSRLTSSSPHTLTEIVTLASIVEAEANNSESMRLVAGVFENRLAAGMPLQADATIEYDLDQDLNELSDGTLAKELRQRDTPYNTYRYRGLPPTPIGNPGLTALEAVVTPQTSDYFYYLTAPDGTFHYAKTLAEHNANIEHYLRQKGSGE